MKNKFVIALAALLVFALAAVAFAYNQAPKQTQTSAAHCEMMKNHHAGKTESGEHKDCCGANADCCKDGKCCEKKESCPMKRKDAQTQTASVDLTNVTVVGDETGGENCCAPGAECCKGGACCKKKS